MRPTEPDYLYGGNFGALTIQLNRSNCTSNNTPAQVFTVTLTGCAEEVGCDDIYACNYSPTVTLADPSLCCYENCANLQLFDSGGDGWEGAEYLISDVSGALVYSGTLDAGAYELLPLCLLIGCYSLAVTSGAGDAEISWALSGSGFGMLTGSAGEAANFSAGGVTCGCTDPTACNFNVAADTDDGSCCDESCVTISAGGGSQDGQISWEIVQNAAVVLSGGANIGIEPTTCLSGCYTLNLYDSGGNGWDGATIMIENQNGIILFVGSLSAYAPSGTFSFCTEAPQDFGCTNVNPPGCPAIDAGEDRLVSCADACLVLQADVFETCESTAYRVESIPYTPPLAYGEGVPVSIGVDDVWSYETPLPFEFCFYGSSYNRMVVGSNGLISFNLDYALEFCPWSFSHAVPSASLPLNSIFGPYHDIDPSVCGTVTYSICGEEPCRFAVISFNDVCHYQCTNIRSSSQIVIYETTNVVEVYIGDKPVCNSWNAGNAVIGIQNASGTRGIVANNRQTTSWTANSEAWRFIPDGNPNYEVRWYHENTELAVGTDLAVCATETPLTYRAEAL